MVEEEEVVVMLAQILAEPAETAVQQICWAAAEEALHDDQKCPKYQYLAG